MGHPSPGTLALSALMAIGQCSDNVDSSFDTYDTGQPHPDAFVERAQSHFQERVPRPKKEPEMIGVTYRGTPPNGADVCLRESVILPEMLDQHEALLACLEDTNRYLPDDFSCWLHVMSDEHYVFFCGTEDEFSHYSDHVLRVRERKLSRPSRVSDRWVQSG